MIGGHFPRLSIRYMKRQTYQVDSKLGSIHATGNDFGLSRTTKRAYVDMLRIINC